MKCTLIYCKCKDCQDTVSMKGLYSLLKDRYERCLTCDDTGYYQDRAGFEVKCSCPPDAFIKNMKLTMVKK